MSFSLYVKLKKCGFLKNVLEVWTIFVRNILGNIFGIWGPKWSPYVAEVSPYGLQNYLFRWAFGPSTRRDPFWMVLRSRVIFSIYPGDPSSPETSRHRMAEVTLATLWRSKARFLMDFGSQVSHRFLHQFLIDVGSMLGPFRFHILPHFSSCDFGSNFFIWNIRT